MEIRIALLERLQLFSVDDLLHGAIAVDQTDGNRQLAVGAVLGHAFQRRDPDAAGDEDRGTSGVEEVVAKRSLYDDGVARLQRGEGALEGRVDRRTRTEVRPRRTRGEGYRRTSWPSTTRAAGGELRRSDVECAGFSNSMPCVVGVRGRDRTTRGSNRLLGRFVRIGWTLTRFFRNRRGNQAVCASFSKNLEPRRLVNA